MRFTMSMFGPYDAARAMASLIVQPEAGGDGGQWTRLSTRGARHRLRLRVKRGNGIATTFRVAYNAADAVSSGRRTS